MTLPMTSAPIIRLGGSQLTWELAAHLLDVSVERGLRRPSRAEITIEDPGFRLLTDQAATFAPGTDVTVGFPSPDGAEKTVFSGTVTGLRVSCPSDGDYHTAVTIVAQDAAYGLSTVGKAASTANAGLADALRAALSAHLSGTISIGGLPAGTRDSVIVACSPYDLLEQVCERYGVEWWVEPADKSLNVGATPSAPTAVALDLGEDLLDLDFHTNATATGTVSMRGWDPAAKQHISGQNSVTGATSRTPALLTGSNGFAQADSSHEYQTRALSVTDSADLTAQASAQAARFAHSGTVLTARTAQLLPGIAPRNDLVLAGAGPLSGTHPVVAVRHDWGQVTGTTIVAGDRALGAIPIRTPLADRAAYSPPLAPIPPQTIGGTVGLLPGLVTDINDPKSWGRVKVKLPTLGENVLTGWARTVLPAAGPGRGLVVPHRVDDEVLVGFEEGDLQRPVVLGALHNGKDTTPVATSGRAEDLSAGLTSANGHLLVLTDATSKDANGVKVQHADGHQVLLSGDQVLIKAEQGTPLKLQAGQASITLDAQGNVAIKGVTVTISGQSAVDLKAPSIGAKADASLTLQAAMSTTVKGATVAVTADAMASVKGATVAIN
jgi:hypothetical protein